VVEKPSDGQYSLLPQVLRLHLKRPDVADRVAWVRRAWCQCLSGSSGSGGAADQLGSEDALFCVDRLLGNARRHSDLALPRQLLVVRTISVVAEGAAAATSALTRWLPRKPLAPSTNALSSAMLVEVQFRHSG
jgi:hypothetical protein